MSATLIDQNGLMTIGYVSPAIKEGSYTFAALNPSKGFLKLTLKKGATVLASIQAAIASLAQGQEMMLITLGAEAAGVGNNSSKISYVLPADSDEYTYEVEVAGKVDCSLQPSVADSLYMRGNGQGSISITAPVTSIL